MYCQSSLFFFDPNIRPFFPRSPLPIGACLTFCYCLPTHMDVFTAHFWDWLPFTGQTPVTFAGCTYALPFFAHIPSWPPRRLLCLVFWLCHRGVHKCLVLLGTPAGTTFPLMTMLCVPTFGVLFRVKIESGAIPHRKTRTDLSLKRYFHPFFTIGPLLAHKSLL